MLALLDPPRHQLDQEAGDCVVVYSKGINVFLCVSVFILHSAASHVDNQAPKDVSCSMMYCSRKYNGSLALPEYQFSRLISSCLRCQYLGSGYILLHARVNTKENEEKCSRKFVLF